MQTGVRDDEEHARSRRPGTGGPVGAGTAWRWTAWTWTRAWALAEVRWAVVATGFFAAGASAWLVGAPAWASWGLLLACYGAGGWEPALAGVKALRVRTLDVDLLMVVAAAGAAAIGQVLDGALLIVIFATSGALEAVATARTADAVRALLDLAPETATRLSPPDRPAESNGRQGEGGVEETVPAAELAVGDVILVRPGERIAADGRVIAGASDVDEATITGEPLPAVKHVGDEVFAGTGNGTGALRIRVSRPAGDTVVARIVAMVDEASRTKARSQLFIEKVEQRYSVVMVAATVVLFVVPLLFGAELRPTLLRAMTFMIVASPCAVVLATMPPLLAAMANAGRHGVLVKSAVVMERLGRTTRVAFDKTGTLTRGVPRLERIELLPGATAALGLASGEREVLALAAAAERPSQHPLGRAIVTAAHDAALTLSEAEDFVSIPGRGVTARVDGHQVQIGSPAHLLDDHVRTQTVATMEAAGQTAVAMAVDGRPAAVMGLADQMRPDAPTAVAALKTLTGTAPALLTGDSSRAASALAGRLAITDVRADLLPQDKAQVVRDIEDGGQRVLLVGDGVNDAPALAEADTGVAMGEAGSDLALDTADAVIIRDDLTAIPAAIALSRRAHRLVTANLITAAAFITILVAWDLLGHLPLPLGVLGHEGSTVIVGLNGLRLLRSAAWPRPAQSAHPGEIPATPHRQAAT
ncbi:heavy metal translocating P-type ATPase [Actinomadura sp. 3N407]|uniref:heavy metal translocating P-type ATPase n=1 Tax=Actinomadura sp. 3N407 TaxID=3457423 RepID=UPI003FCECC1C